ncbi:hypothetical protein GCK72_004708 [Caenorhabditis remanei]|uniref:histone acetyltransferase n=1 Tax=Caenorhabditis remanei TaxID=31234 RepID=A0A6A5HAG4_CAERE|nr:hypothetical protein GCK72_004708 [Caenorhabditis remanei]KAF1764758.1 hypothetical protein GCK72_004708 [Caenorhabditis remanei]
MPVTLLPNDYSSLLFPDQPNQKPLSFFGCLTINFWKTNELDTGICSGRGLGCGGTGSGVYFTNCHQLTPLVPRVQFDSMDLKGVEEGHEVPENEQCVARSLPPRHPRCNMILCPSMKRMLEHLPDCDGGVLCERNVCQDIEQLIGHWKNCKDEGCIVCKPILEEHDKKIESPQFQFPHDMLFIPVHVSYINDIHLGGKYSMLAGYTESPFLSTTVVNNYEPSQFMRLIKESLRDHLRQKIYEAMIQTPDPSPLCQAREENLREYAMRIEKEVLIESTSLEVYYARIALKIQKLLQEKFGFDQNFNSPWQADIPIKKRHNSIIQLLNTLQPCSNCSVHQTEQNLKDLLVYCQSVEENHFMTSQSEQEYFEAVDKNVEHFQKIHPGN